MVKAVRYDEFGGIDVLQVEEVERPVPGDGQVLVRVKAAGINPSEAVIRTGAVAELFPSTFPSGQGSDLAGVIEEVGAGVGGFSPGDEVIGFNNKQASRPSWSWSRSATSRASRRRSPGRRPEACSSPARPRGGGTRRPAQGGRDRRHRGSRRGVARSPSSSRAVPGPRSSAWRARATTSG